jgi:hypothetical protein
LNDYAISCAIRREWAWGGSGGAGGGPLRDVPEKLVRVLEGGAGGASGRALIAVRWRRSPVLLERYDIGRPEPPEGAALLGSREPGSVFLTNDKRLPTRLLAFAIAQAADQAHGVHILENIKIENTERE